MSIPLAFWKAAGSTPPEEPALRAEYLASSMTWTFDNGGQTFNDTDLTDGVNNSVGVLLSATPRTPPTAPPAYDTDHLEGFGSAYNAIILDTPQICTPFSTGYKLETRLRIYGTTVDVNAVSVIGLGYPAMYVVCDPAGTFGLIVVDTLLGESTPVPITFATPRTVAFRTVPGVGEYDIILSVDGVDVMTHNVAAAMLDYDPTAFRPTPSGGESIDTAIEIDYYWSKVSSIP